MKQLLIITGSAFIGLFIGFFGVFNSVFSDGALKERLITIAVILAVYLILGLVLGIVLPSPSWKSGLPLGIPGAVLLLLYTTREFNPYYIVYMLPVLVLPCFGTWIGGKARRGG